MYQSLCILGRQPFIGLAELESLFGPDKIRSLEGAALLEIDASLVPFARLGGTVKLAKVLMHLDTTKWAEIEHHLAQIVLDRAKQFPDGKLKMGLSVYGLTNITPKMLERTGLSLKKLLVKAGRSTRLVPNIDLALSSAQVIHNNLVGQLGWEMILIKDGGKVILAQTTTVQDIAAYAARDQARPKRDARVGMLPPKLAQTIINLAVPGFRIPNSEFRILDPFCGTGVILQEALLMGYSVIGTDIEPRLIEYSAANLKWLSAKYQIPKAKYSLEVGDATKNTWPAPIGAVASETYLGQPLSALPPKDQLDKIVNFADKLHANFLKNIRPQLKTDARLCLAIPAWKLASGFRHLPCIDHLGELGYTRLSFTRVRNEDLIYHREGQIVARELLVAIRV